MTVAAVKSPPEAPPSTLVEKLAAVMAAVERVPKNGWNDFHKYHYATEADLSDAVRSNLARHGVMLIPTVDKLEWRTVQAKNGEEKIATLTVRFTATDGKDKIDFTVIGEGQDRGDKATYKAMTGATKYALLKLFLIPTGDDPETEEDEHPHKGAPPKPQQVASKPSPPPPVEPAKVPPPHVAALWKRCKDKYGDKATENWEGAAASVFGDAPIKSSDWSVVQAQDVERALFPAKDIPF
jgi:hypothetical protein